MPIGLPKKRVGGLNPLTPDVETPKRAASVAAACAAFVKESTISFETLKNNGGQWTGEMGAVCRPTTNLIDVYGRGTDGQMWTITVAGT